MRDKLRWGIASYDILSKGNAVMSYDKTSCFSQFMNRGFTTKYDTIRLRDIDCEKTFEYRDFYLNYVIEMFGLKASFNEEYFEFESLGIKLKDAAVMTVIRFLWENIGDKQIDTPNLFFKRLRDEEGPYDDKLARFCHFYKELDTEKPAYFSDGHSWVPKLAVIKTTNDFVQATSWSSVNSFFTTNS